MELSRVQRNMTFAAFMVFSTVGAFLQNALTTALPAIMQDFGITASTGQWLTSGYTLATAIMIPATAYLILRFPVRQLFFAAVSLCLMGALLCVVVKTFPLLFLGRILQACGSGIMLPLTQVAILTIYPAEKCGSMMGIYGLAVGIAPMISPTLSGLIIDLWNWRMVFVLAIVLLVLDFIFALVGMRNFMETERLRFDSYSMLLCAVGLSGLLLGLGNLGQVSFLSPVVLLPLLLGLVALALFTRRQLRSDAPLLDLRVFRERSYTQAVLISMLLYGVMMASAVLFPVYFQSVGGLTATVSGLILLPGSILMSVVSPFAGRIYDKYGMRKLAVYGSLLLTISCCGLMMVGATVSVPYVAVLYALRMISIGMLLMPVVSWGMSELSVEQVTHGTAVLSSLRMASGAIFSAVLVAVMSFVSLRTSRGADVLATAQGIDASFAAMAILAAVLLFFSVFCVEKKRKALC